MAKKKKKTTRKKKAQPRFQALRNIEWASVKRGMKALAWLIGIGCVVGAAWYGVPRLEAHAIENSQVQTIEINFVDPPAWVQGDLEEYLLRTIEPLLVRDPFNRAMLQAVRRDLLNTGWFERIDQVRRVREDRIDVHGLFVDPYAVVRDEHGDHLVDTRGKLLPRTFSHGQSDKFVVLTGARFPRPGRPGMQWEGADIDAGLALLRLIEAEPWRHQAVEVNISGVIRGEAIRLVTDRGTRIIWGSRPGEESTLEAPYERKLYYLGHFFREYGHIDTGSDATLDIRSLTSVNQTND